MLPFPYPNSTPYPDLICVLSPPYNNKINTLAQIASYTFGYANKPTQCEQYALIDQGAH